MLEHFSLRILKGLSDLMKHLEQNISQHTHTHTHVWCKPSFSAGIWMRFNTALYIQHTYDHIWRLTHTLDLKEIEVRNLSKLCPCQQRSPTVNTLPHLKSGSAPTDTHVRIHSCTCPDHWPQASDHTPKHICTPGLLWVFSGWSWVPWGQTVLDNGYWGGVNPLAVLDLVAEGSGIKTQGVLGILHDKSFHRVTPGRHTAVCSHLISANMLDLWNENGHDVTRESCHSSDELCSCVGSVDLSI